MYSSTALDDANTHRQYILLCSTVNAPPSLFLEVTSAVDRCRRRHGYRFFFQPGYRRRQEEISARIDDRGINPKGRTLPRVHARPSANISVRYQCRLWQQVDVMSILCDDNHIREMKKKNTYVIIFSICISNEQRVHFWYFTLGNKKKLFYKLFK